ncbi:MAG: ABC transporter permease subunit, partial [Clostridia bacterium]|nr:ABC transporter permease subunit [Clostridia bacterium]
CSNFRFFTRIVLPLAMPVLFSVGISSFVNLWNAYIWPLLITNKQEMRVVQVGVTMLSTEDSVNYGPVMAAVSFVLVPSMLIFLIFQRRIVRGIITGSLKE